MKIKNFSIQKISLLFVVVFFFSCSGDDLDPGRSLNGTSFSTAKYTLVNEEFISAASMQQTEDGGYILAGDMPRADVGLLKINQNFEIEWIETVGGVQNESSVAVKEISDGGFVFFGNTQNDFFLVKTDNQGKEEWANSYGTNLYEIGRGIELTPDGGYIMIGYTGEIAPPAKDVLIIKTDRNGNEIWRKTIDDSPIDEGLSVVKTDDDHFIISFFTGNFLDKELHLAKMDTDGNILWDKVISEKLSDAVLFSHTISKTSDNGVITAFPETDEDGLGQHINLTKINEVGDVEWFKVIEAGSGDHGYMAIETNDGGYAVLGVTQSFGNGFVDGYLVKTDELGNVLWENTYGGGGYDDFSFLIETNDGGFAFCGTATSTRELKDFKMIMVKTDENGTPE